MYRSKLSRREAKARMRFIQERNYDKREQRILDSAVAQMGMSYVELYEKVRLGFVYMFMAQIGADRLAKAWKSVGVSAAEAITAVKMLCDALRCQGKAEPK